MSDCQKEKNMKILVRIYILLFNIFPVLFSRQVDSLPYLISPLTHYPFMGGISISRELFGRLPPHGMLVSPCTTKLKLTNSHQSPISKI